MGDNYRARGYVGFEIGFVKRTPSALRYSTYKRHGDERSGGDSCFFYNFTLLLKLSGICSELAMLLYEEKRGQKM